MLRLIMLGGAFAIIGFGLPRTAAAGDEVDYSAPYITVEDGELVTKYPTRQHVPGTPAARSPENEASEISKPNVGSLIPWMVTAAAIVLALVMLLLLKKRRRRA